MGFRAILRSFPNLWTEPHTAIDIVKELKPDVVVADNYDYVVAYDTDCKCARKLHELSEYTRKSYLYEIVIKGQVEWLKAFPKTIEVAIESRKFYVVHGNPRNCLHGYMKLSPSLDELKPSLTLSMIVLKPKLLQVDTVVADQTHVPMDINIDCVRAVNSRSCRKPSYDDYRASYAVYGTKTNVLEIRRVEYDIDKVVSNLKDLRAEG